MPTISRAQREAEQRALIDGTVGAGHIVTGVSALGGDTTARDQLNMTVNSQARGGYGIAWPEALAATAADGRATLLGYDNDIGNKTHRAAAAALIATAASESATGGSRRPPPRPSDGAERSSTPPGNVLWEAVVGPGGLIAHVGSTVRAGVSNPAR